MTARIRSIALGALGGALLAELVVAVFIGALLLLAQNAELQTGLTAPVVDTLALWPYLAIPALPAGMAVGAIAGRIERRRVAILIALAAASYLVVAIAAVSWMSAASTPGDRAAMVLVGVWAALAYGLIAVPLWVGAVILLERWTRPSAGCRR